MVDPRDATPAWHALSAHEALIRLHSDAERGLDPEQATTRLTRHGPNRLPPPRRRSALARLALQFHNPLIHVLLAAGAITLALADYLDAGVIFGVVLINAAIGFVQEGRAERALEAVRALLANRATVVRHGERHLLDAAELVPGDILLLEPGDRVAADVRLLAARDLHLDEAPLTGESLPVAKTTEPVDRAAAVGDRHCLAFSGTLVTRGQGRGLVVATGVATEIGRIGALVAGVGSMATPLARRLDRFARRISTLILAGGTLVFAYAHLGRGVPLLDSFLVVVGLAVAAIPEGLPAIVTIALAVGTRAMARRNAVVRRLPAVEALGSVTVICTDKTGTLTRNEMTAVAVLLPGRDLAVSGAGYGPEGGFQEAGTALDPNRDAQLLALARCALLCNDAQLRRGDGAWLLAGDPTEGALLSLAFKAGLQAAAEQSATPRRDAIPFAAEQRFMATLHHDHRGGGFILLKGAPETVLALCTSEADGTAVDGSAVDGSAVDGSAVDGSAVDGSAVDGSAVDGSAVDGSAPDVAAWEHRLATAAGSGMRLLALARRELAEPPPELEFAAIAPGFTLLGVVGLMDPPRPEAVAAIAECRQAGIRTLMITGDHPATAVAIGAQLGLRGADALTGPALDPLDDAALAARLATTDVIARASPEHKLRLVRVLQAQGELVAMTGDGVNDAPALKAADVGVAMGLRGTDAAREAADLVLGDDNFATLAAAVRQGRTVYDNIRKSLLFILPTNGGEVGVILLALLAGLALPITAAQILWINLVTTVTLDLALAFEPTEPDVMQRPPRPPREPLITRDLMGRILVVSLLMMASTFAIYEWQLARGGDLDGARTAAVNMLALGELAYLFAMRRFGTEHFWRGLLAGNRVALGAGATLILLQLGFTYLPWAQRLFATRALDGPCWLAMATLALAIFTLAAALRLRRKS